MKKPVALTRPEIDERLRSLASWTYTDGAIRRTYQTDGWRGSLLVTNAIAYICEAADHHADILVTWPKVSVALSTHSAGGITELDFEVALLIERQVTWKPATGSALAGPSQPIVKS